MADDDLQALGVLLRQTREAHALSLEEVEEQTRIRVKFLRALEGGDISVLPSAAHAKGFLRNYAQFLRLDANAIVNQFAELTGSGVAPVTVPTAPPTHSHAPSAPSIPAFEQQVMPEDASAPAVTPPLPTRSTGKTRPLHVTPEQWVGPATPLGVSQAGAPDARPRPEKPPSALGRYFRSNVLVGAALAVGMIAIVWWAISQLSTITGSELIPTEQISEGTMVGLSATSTGQVPATQPTVAPSPTVRIPPFLDRVLLTITVTQRTWVRVIVDGEVAFEGQAEPGKLLQYTGQQSVVVVAGNGAGLDTTYNGQAIGPLGEFGEAVERIFTPTGQTTPTPTQTLTPTSTSVPSATPRFTPTPTRKP